MPELSELNNNPSSGHLQQEKTGIAGFLS